MDTITTIQNLLKSNGSAQPVTVALMPSETRLIAAAPDMYEALKAVDEHIEYLAQQRKEPMPSKLMNQIAVALAKVQP